MRYVKVTKIPRAFLRMLSCCLLFHAAGIQAAIYQWQDADGTTVYSQLPPQDGSVVREVGLPPPPGTTPEKAQQELRQMQDAFRKRIENRERKAQERSSEETAEDIRNRNCQAARRNLSQIRSQARLLVDDGQGGRKRMTESEKQQRIQQYQADVQKYCR